MKDFLFKLMFIAVGGVIAFSPMAVSLFLSFCIVWGYFTGDL